MLANLRAEDSEQFDPAYRELLANAILWKDEILEAAKYERDYRVKSILIEVLGETRDHSVIPYVATQLESDISEVKFWAKVALQSLRNNSNLTPEDRVLVDQRIQMRQRNR